MAASSLSGRRSAFPTFLHDLNAIQVADVSPVDVEYDNSDELAIFTNTNFLDADSGLNTDFQASILKTDRDYTSSTASPVDDLSIGSLSSINFLPGDFDIISGFPTGLAGYSDQHLDPGYAALVAQQHSSAFAKSSGMLGGKPNPDAMAAMVPTSTPAGPLSPDPLSQLAVDEDKRKRNTLASARFRVKKKQREQALEKNVVEMSQKISMLESKVQQLETENKWLKNLIMEKNDGKKDLGRFP